MNHIKHVLSFDGAGIYGLNQALWMKWLTDALPTFLDWPGSEGCSDPLFAGTSSGAVNALLLARYPHPRGHVGDLVDFWHERGPWANDLFPQALTSLVGLSAWYGTNDYLQTLTKYFGEIRMEELTFPVMVTSYDLHDARHAGDPTRHSQPLALTNFPIDDPGVIDVSNEKVVDVAYWATAVPSLRAVRGGRADGGFASADPTLQAILAAGVHATESQCPPPALVQFLRSALLHNDEQGFNYREVLQNLAVLSIGDGGPATWYWLPDFDFGVQWPMFPSNPAQLPAGFWPPSNYPLNPTNDLILQISEGMLEPGRLFRLNPRVMPIPTALTIYAPRMNISRLWFLSLMSHALHSPKSIAALEAAKAFLQGPGWTD